MNPPTPRLVELSELLALSEKATPDWRLGKHGAITGGPFHQFTNGSAQSQVASFSVMTHSETAQDEQLANAEFAVALVNWFRATAPTLTQAQQAGDSRLDRLIRVGDLPAPITNPEAWPAGYADGFNDYASYIDQTPTATPPARVVSDEDVFPELRVNIADPHEPDARIVGFRIKPGHPWYGKHGLSEPLFAFSDLIDKAQAALTAGDTGVGNADVFSGIYPPHPSLSDNTGWATGLVLYIDSPKDGGPETRQGAYDYARRTFIDSTTATPIEPDYWQVRPRFSKWTKPTARQSEQGA